MSCLRTIWLRFSGGSKKNLSGATADLPNRPPVRDYDSQTPLLNDVITSARGADIHSLREKGISYIKLEQSDKQIDPRIDPAAPKSLVRGHQHPVFSRLLCSVKYLVDFDSNPAE